MPYKLITNNHNGYKVENIYSGDVFSREWLPLHVAENQLKALYINLHDGDDEDNLYGSGIGDVIRNFGRRIANIFTNNFSPEAEKAIKLWGNYNVKEFSIHRVPIDSGLKVALKIVSFGTFKYEPYYDELFHLFIVFRINNGKNDKYILTEKVGNIVFEERRDFSASKTKQEDMMNGYIIGNFTVTDMIVNAMKILGNDFQKYNPVTNNCMRYVQSLLNGMNIYEFDSFITQDIEKVLIGHTRSSATAFTDIQHFFGRLTGGEENIYEKYY